MIIIGAGFSAPIEEKARFHDNRVILVAILELRWHPVAVDIKGVLPRETV